MKINFKYTYLGFLSIFFWVLVGIVIPAEAYELPEKGVPLMENFAPVDYFNNGKIWAIDTAPNGVVYMAADKGLLEYDGKNWKSYKGSDGFIRSVSVANDSLIYTGSDLDFGYWRLNKYNDFEYTSLYPFKDELAELNEEFWDVHVTGNTVLFVSKSNIYIYNNQSLTKINAPSRFTGSFLVDDSLYFVDENQGVFLFKDLSLTNVIAFTDEFKPELSGMYINEEELILVTKNSGLYAMNGGQLKPINSPLSQILKTSNVFSFETVNANYLAFGTVLNGLFITNLDGEIIHYINRQKGLPNNTILSLHYGPAGILWLGMDYGISSLDLLYSSTFFYDYRGDFGTGYTAIFKDGTFYLGSNQGLYKSSWDGLNNDTAFNEFELISGSEGQVWALEYIDNDILIAHDKGLFQLNNEQLERIYNQIGIWTILEYKDYLLAGTYNGIAIFEKSGNNWTYLKQMEYILGSCNQLIMAEDDILWVNIPNFGIIKIELDTDLYPVERTVFSGDSFEGDDILLTKNEGDIILITDEYQYTYSNTENEFISEPVSNSKPNIKGLIPGIFSSIHLENDYHFFPVYNGFALKFMKNEHMNIPFENNIIFRNIEAFDNDQSIQVYDGGIIDYELNNLRIEYIVPNQKDVLYQVKSSESDEWGEWVSENSIELINLEHGSHELYVRAMVDDNLTETEVIQFQIATPWHLSWFAYFVYLMGIALLIYLFYFWQKISLKKQKKDLLVLQQNSLREQAEKYRQQMNKFEQERMQLEYDELKVQLKNKTIELANKAKENEDKNRLLVSLKEKIKNIQKKPDLSKAKIDEIYKLIDSFINDDDNTFEIQMDELHQEFFKKIKKQFPVLSNNDLRLCAYIKLGFTTNEIAELLNIQPSSAYITRSRLRKKLMLDANQDLYDFLNSF